jgi:hypothetical protein
MFKKHMTPLSKKGTLDNRPGKGNEQRDLPGAATGGGPSSFQSYGKATPMAQPAPPNTGIGSGSWSGNGIA